MGSRGPYHTRRYLCKYARYSIEPGFETRLCPAFCNALSCGDILYSNAFYFGYICVLHISYIESRSETRIDSLKGVLNWLLALFPRPRHVFPVVRLGWHGAIAL